MGFSLLSCMHCLGFRREIFVVLELPCPASTRAILTTRDVGASVQVRTLYPRRRAGPLITMSPDVLSCIDPYSDNSLVNWLCHPPSEGRDFDLEEARVPSQTSIRDESD